MISILPEMLQRCLIPITKSIIHKGLRTDLKVLIRQVRIPEVHRANKEIQRVLKKSAEIQSF